MYHLHDLFRQYTCDECLRVFSRKGNMLRHKRVHEQKVENVVCSECQKNFSNAHNLKIHLRDVHNATVQSDTKSILVCNKGNAVIQFSPKQL